jgi:hypothetical protein
MQSLLFLIIFLSSCPEGDFLMPPIVQGGNVPHFGHGSGMRPLQAHLNRFWDSRLSQTNLMNEASDALKISPPWNAPRWLWSFAWKLQKFMMPVLHFFDECAPKDSHLNLAVLWWKAMAGNRIGTITYDGGVAYDLLPHYSRNVVAFPFCYFYPPLHHQTVAMRTAFLDATLDDVCQQLAMAGNNQDDGTRVITLGAGFDTRSLRYLEKQQKNEVTTAQSSKIDFYEIDLPSVVEQKTSIFRRYQQRRKGSKSQQSPLLPRLYGADLDDLEKVQQQLLKIFDDTTTHRRRRPTVIMVEAVLMYLKQETVMPLLKSCMKEAAKHSNDVYFVFADRLPNMPHNDGDPSVERKAAEQLLKTVGLTLTAYQGKPGRARHMGVAIYDNKF